MKTFGWIMLGLFGLVILTGIGFACNIGSIFMGHVETSAKNAVVNYDNYQETYNTCKEIDTKIGALRETPDNDGQFTQFSKNAQINALKMQLARWVEDYNAKSKEIDKNLWKSHELPYQLNVNDFSNYNNKN